MRKRDLSEETILYIGLGVVAVHFQKQIKNSIALLSSSPMHGGCGLRRALQGQQTGKHKYVQPQNAT